MADATSFTPPSPGLGATLLSNKHVEPYSPKGPENVKITTLHRCTGRLFRAAPRLRLLVSYILDGYMVSLQYGRLNVA